MPVALALVVVDAILIVHAARAGRLSPWGSVIVAVPGVGALAYVAVELIPAWLKHRRCRSARRRIRRALAPERRYRALLDQLALADTIANRTTLAEECRQLGLFEEALRHYDDILARPRGAAPTILLGKAHAEFGLGRFAETVAILDALQRRWPSYASRAGHLLYACALKEGGRVGDALDDRAGSARADAGPQPRVRRARSLRGIGRARAADASLPPPLVDSGRAPTFACKARAEWTAAAEEALRG